MIQIRFGFQKKKVILYHDNAPVHKCTLRVKQIGDMTYELLEHPRYSANLVPSDCNLTPNLLKLLTRRFFGFNSPDSTHSTT